MMKRLIKKVIIIQLVLLGVILALKAMPMTYTLNLTNAVEGPESYKFERYILNTLADSNDTVVINILSPGGSAIGGILLINDILNSKAHIVSYNETAAYSAAAVIAIAADEVKAAPYSTYLFHRARMVIFSPKGIETRLLDADNPVEIMFTEFANDRIFPLLTDEEIIRYKAGEDVTLTGTQLLARIANLKGAE